MKLSLLPLFALSLTAAANESFQSSGAWERANDWDIGEVLFPNLHLHGVGGFTTGEQAELASGGHDPQRGPFSAQALEPGLSMRTRYFEGFANYLFFQDGGGDWDGELEEIFGKILNIPGGFEIKGGQYLSRFGALNDKHLHAWDFVDSEMVLGRFLGDDGLLLQGGELSWTLPFGMDPAFVSIASLGFGNARAHDHEHGHHEHEGEETPHEGEEGALADDVWTARVMGRYRFDDFHSLTGGFSYAGGTNGFGRDTGVFGFDAEYLWRERGLEPGGRAFRWRNEFLWRDVEAFTYHEDDDETFRGSYQEWGFYTHAVWTWNARLDSGLRVGWVEGVDDFGQDERLRVSPSVSWWFDEARRIGLRAQYNYDSIASHNDEHSLWLQLNIALGSSEEVR
ncbi:MAG: hypothetical protein Q8Q59_12725 [Luteolibacter sp.]|jgi:hypothetical protein|nr:hypothetical protein [Luteolibacter sp.]